MSYLASCGLDSHHYVFPGVKGHPSTSVVKHRMSVVIVVTRRENQYSILTVCSMFALNLSASNRKEINFRSKGKGALHKTLCAAVVVAIASTGFPLGPAQASGTYNGTDGTVLCSTSGSFTVLANVVTGHTECVGAVVIPATVTSIGSGGFAGSSINSVVFSSPSTLATIGAPPFQ